MVHRLLQSIRHGHRRRRSVCGLMLDLGRKQTRPMAPLTSWNILPSRYDSIDLQRGDMRADHGFRAPATERNSNWSWKLRIWVVISMPIHLYVRIRQIGMAEANKNCSGRTLSITPRLSMQTYPRPSISSPIFFKTPNSSPKPLSASVMLS